MGIENQEIKTRQKRLLYLVGGVALTVTLSAVYLMSPSEQKQLAEEVALDLPSDEISTKDVRFTSLETKNEKLEAKTHYLEGLIKEYKESSQEEIELERSNLNEEIRQLQMQLENREPTQSEQKFINVAPSPASIALPSSKLQIYQCEEEEDNTTYVESIIPAGTTAKALLVSSVDAPCGVQSSADPQPVKLRILADARLPKSVRAKLKGAVLIGSAYGNLSSERVYVRVERMTQVRSDGGFVETDVTGFVTGEDGKYGVRGVVVDRSGQLVASAAFTGFLQGVNQYLQATLNAQTIAKATQGLPSSDIINLDILRNSGMEGASSGLDQISDYFIRRAEQLQPVIQVAAGRTIDITFTHNAEIGDLFTKEKVKQLRERSRYED